MDKKERREIPAAEQPYQIPDNWRWVRLDYPTTIIMGQSPNGDSTTDDKSFVPLIGGAADMGELYPNVTRYTKKPTKVSMAGDIILCVRATLGRPIYSDGEYCLGRGVAAIRPNIGSGKFYRYALICFEQYLLDHAAGSTFAQISSSALKNMPIPLPPSAEQVRIVERVESLFAALDEARERVQAALDGLELWKMAALHEAFTGKLTEEWRNAHPHAPPWAKRALKDCGEWSGGGTPSMARPEYWENGDLLWITPKDMKSDLIEDTLLHINTLAVGNLSARYIAKPSVLFVTRSGILRHALPIAVVKVPFTVNQDLKALSPYDDVDADYLFWACKYYEKAILQACMKCGTTVESVNFRALAAFEIPVAPKEEQLVIAARLQRLFRRQRAVAEIAETALRQIGVMKKVILGRAFRGELGTNDPSEPSAGF